MRRRRSKRYLLAVLLGLGGFLLAFAIVYAGTVQWSRSQPSKVVAVQVEVLPEGAMTLYTDSDLINELTSGDELQFGVLEFQPPLAQFISQPSSLERFLWLKNNTANPSNYVRICCPTIQDQNNVNLVSYFTDVEPCCTRVINPGQNKKIKLRVSRVQSNWDGIIGRPFKLVIGTTGTSGDGTTAPLALEAFLAAQDQQPEPGAGGP